MITDVTATGAPAVPLQIRAHLASSTASGAPWGVALDGLLASELWHDRKARRFAQNLPIPHLVDTEVPEDLALPLARCAGAGGDSWHWAATCAFPEGAAEVEVHHWTSRFDHRAAELAVDALPTIISDRQGRYQARRMPLITTPARSLVWWAVGDLAQIRDLLAPIVAIGKKRSHGEGHVQRWEVQPVADLDPWSAAHLHPNSTLGRPTPETCLKGHTIAGDGGPGTAGLRPPYMHPLRQHDLRLPASLETLR
ncbi:hypothetical protein ACFV9C_44635 [Kribbella sp. NPDC059898]|uniref:hypothetical protein n=1 Tax=Kribbella sp. NPDC059898 TaxID=3346995 RepID=UPI0036660660